MDAPTVEVERNWGEYLRGEQTFEQFANTLMALYVNGKLTKKQFDEEIAYLEKNAHRKADWGVLR